MPFKRCKGANRVLSSPLIGLNSKSKNENEKLEAPCEEEMFVPNFGSFSLY